MKTYNILPWYILLLIVVLCVAIKPTEGMVSQKVVNNESTVDSIVQMLKDKNKQVVKKKQNNIILLVMSDVYKNRTNKTKVVNYLNVHMSAYKYVFIVSEDDTKTNTVLSKISSAQLNKDNSIIVLQCNQDYKTNKPTTQMYLPASENITKKTTKAITKFTSAAAVTSTK